MTTVKRYKKTDYNYAKDYSVECPDCKKEAFVLLNNESKDTIIQCNHCLYKRNYNDFILYKAWVKLNCPNCGKGIHTEQGGFKEKPVKLNVNCPECGFSLQTKPRTEKYNILHKKQGMKHDPLLGFPLWFQDEIKGNLFWAYNRKHLDEILNYVSSELRERQTNWGMTMVERLPGFIKEAGNRELIVKIIARLLKK